jgi:hypothetical protein
VTDTHSATSRTAARRLAGALLVTAMLLAACNGTSGVEPPDGILTPTAPATTPPPDDQPQALDEETAARLYVAWRQTVYALPTTPPESVDATAGDGVVVPDSAAAQWVDQELEQARERGVVVRGDVHAEAIPPVEFADDRATATICSSADVRVTDVASGEPVSDDPVDNAYTRFDVIYRRLGEDWLVEQADRLDERGCVPPSIQAAVAAAWDRFTDAWYERDRQGGGEDIGRLTDVITDEFADILRGLPAREPVAEPPPFTQFELSAASPTTATGRACRSGGVETVEWLLVDGRWRVDFAGQVGQETSPCP